VAIDAHRSIVSAQIEVIVLRAVMAGNARHKAKQGQHLGLHGSMPSRQVGARADGETQRGGTRIFVGVAEENIPAGWNLSASQTREREHARKMKPAFRIEISVPFSCG